MSVQGAQFKVPKFASYPTILSTVKVLHNGALDWKLEVDRKDHYLFGANEDCDFPLSHAKQPYVAALVHDDVSRIYLIDLGSELRTTINDVKIPVDEPTLIQDGDRIGFGDDAYEYVAEVESYDLATYIP